MHTSAVVKSAFVDVAFPFGLVFPLAAVVDPVADFV